jgi:hypothetical protein
MPRALAPPILMGALVGRGRCAVLSANGVNWTEESGLGDIAVLSLVFPNH